LLKASVLLVSTFLIVFAVFLLYSANILNSRKHLSTADHASVLQAFSSGAVLIATVSLVVLTAYYAIVTSSILEQQKPKIEVLLNIAWATYGAGCIVGDFQSMRDSPDERYTEKFIAIVVTSSSVVPITIEAVSICGTRGITYRETINPLGETPPTRLDGYSSKTFYMNFQQAEVMATLPDFPSKMIFASVSISGMGVVNSKKHIF